jgi:hypothetical protein
MPWLLKLSLLIREEASEYAAGSRDVALALLAAPPEGLAAGGLAAVG